VKHAALILLAVAITASAADLNGTWKAVFTGPGGDRPKMVTEIILDLKLSDGKLTGVAHAGAWPGDAGISESAINGDSFTFTVVGHSPWISKGPSGQASGVPKLTFTGSVQQDNMELTLIWDEVILSGNPPAHEPWRQPMKASRLPATRIEQ